MTSSVLVGFVAAGLAGCGGSGGDGGSCTPTATDTIRITSGGTSPKNACVLPNGSVSFINDDTIAHELEFEGPCAGVNTGNIAPSASQAVGFATVGQCPYHDAAAPADAKFQGLVAVTNTVVGGGGY